MSHNDRVNDRERQLLPYEATALRGERLLVLAPHPDDEVIGCGGLIAQHLAEKRRVLVIVVSDGAAGTTGSTLEREAESRNGLDALGGGCDLRFLRFADRSLADNLGELEKAIADAVQEFDPDLIAVPSPVEVHPDHAALSEAFSAFAQRPANNARALTRVAFYEVSQPMQPNALVDITDVAELKYRAIACHVSQLAARNYVDYARGLNAYRAMTLPGSEARFAEAYAVFALPDFALQSRDHFARATAPKRVPSTASETLPISVIVRTKNRKHLLREALESVRRSDYPAQIVVVNDGGESPADLKRSAEFDLVDLTQSVGRSEAMNRGVQSATGRYIAFLDDDDLFYSDHLPLLARAAQSSAERVVYSDAASVFLERSDDGSFREKSRHRLFSEDFDPALLAIDNYIPLTTLLVRRDDYLDAGGFDPQFDLFEDWDFLLRLAQKTRFVHVARLTCEVRHFPTGDSLMMQAAGESARMREGKEKIWRKHSALLTHETLSDAIERRKASLLRWQQRAIEQEGRARHVTLDVERLSREKEVLLDELTAAGRRFGEVESNLHATAEHARQLEGLLAAAQQRATDLERHRDILADDQREKNDLIARLYDEIARLNGVLETIYGSRTWKLHEMVERMKPRR